MIRGGILITGTEVLTGIITDKNGPWLSEQMRASGIQPAQITVVGDRPEDLLAGLESMKAQGLDLIVTSGGLGPTADDLTAEVVGRFQQREMALDEALEERIAEILRSLSARWPNLDMESVRAANRKQAVIPTGSTVLEPVGTAPGLLVGPRDGDQGPLVLVLPGPPRELKPMWRTALATEPLSALVADAPAFERRMIRIFGIPESELAASLRSIEETGLDLSQLEVTTCLRRGEIEIATSFAPAGEGAYQALLEQIRERHGALIFSEDERTIDELVAGLLQGSTVAVAESCTGGLLCTRLTDLPGASDYVLGGVVSYSNAVKEAALGVPSGMLAEHGAVSEPVAVAMAEGVRSSLGSEMGVGITGIAGPGGGTDEKPVGLVWIAVLQDGKQLVRSVVIPGGRADIRDRSTTIALHLMRRLMLGESD
ncbi:MAG: competence/damage-inducible protein A [Actinobacteria bacterium]|nr:competence/damage-inducible protein A [Actinomycetota bacterium]